MDKLNNNEKQIINKRIFHNSSTPLLFENTNSIKNQLIISNANAINKKAKFKPKLSPLITSNLKSLNRITRNKNILSINPFIKNAFLISSNTNNKNSSVDEQKSLISSGELANEDANYMMNKYFYPDRDELHEKQNKINEEIDINKIMTFYSKIKYNKEKEEIKKIINRQKKEIIFTNNEDEDDNYNMNYNKNKNKINPSSSAKSIFKKNIKIDSYDTINSPKNNYKNNFIRLDVSKKIYHSPLHSLDTMKKNKLIYDIILKNYNNNRIKSYKRLEHKLEPLLKLKLNLDNKKQNNIKILPFIPKMEETNYIITNHEEEDKNKNHKYNKIKINKKEEIDFSKINHRIKEKYLLYNKIQYPNKNFPESRSQFIFVQEGKEFILHGGYNVSRKYNLWKFIPSQKSWESIEPLGIKSEIRYAHSGVLRFRNLYIFGGKNFKGTNFADLEVFSLDKKSWIFPKLETNKLITLRRNHIACGVGNTMFVHGGINEDNKYLDDMFILNYKPLKWEDLDISNKIKLPPLAHHSCCLVVSEMIINSSKFNIYNCPNIGKSRLINNIKEKGIYIFGGKMSDDGPINNNLFVLKIGKKPLEWTILNTFGSPPCPRYDNSINFYERGNMLVIHGGRTNKNKRELALNDTFILDLYSYNWIEVEYFNREYKVPPRFYHQAIIFKGELYIFGGLNENEYIGSEMLVLDLNSNAKCEKEKNIFLFKMNHSNKMANKNMIGNKEENKKENSKIKYNKNINNEMPNKLKRIKII